jgi:hypothetical protein
VAEFSESPFRIPAPLARKAYDAGESGMGYMIFTLELQDGSQVPCVTGSAYVDFVLLPEGVRSNMIVNLRPHKGREEIDKSGRSSADTQARDELWCPFVWPNRTPG